MAFSAGGHLSHAVVDSGLERKICAVLDAHDEVQAWVKNHKLFLEIPYLYFGITHRYRPDFVVRMRSGLTVLLEGKGNPDEKDDAKATAARRWIEAANTWNGLGTWIHHVCYDPATLDADLSALHGSGRAPAPRGEMFPQPSDEEHGEDLRRHGRPDRRATR
ncbi:hypothetical protein [Micromonospora rhizosphaerae]|uniref:hypothetical protein n=1 Tax=Micromonospora rhizosphaerae TaxID=568872 RepID=UPI000B043C66|nr:hypothetical protein [Micromonospora rhizosphaerae]